MWVTTARFAHCARCTNCSRHFCTEDYSQCLTRNQQKIRLASENPTRQQTTLQHTDWLNRDAMSWESKSGQRQLTSRKCSIPYLPNQFGMPSNLATSATTASASWSRYTRTKGICPDRRREQHFRHPEWNKTKWSAVQLFLFNTVLQCSLKDEIPRWQKKEGMGIYLSDHDHEILTNLRFADDVILFATSKEQIRKMLCGFKNATEKAGLRVHPDKTKILSNQSTINLKKHLEVDGMNIEILTRNESVKYLGHRVSFYQQETTEIKCRVRAALATFHKYRQDLTSKNYMLGHRLRLFDATAVCYPAGTWAPNKENERMSQSTQDATTHHPDKQMQKYCETRHLAQRRKWRSWHQWNV